MILRHSAATPAPPSAGWQRFRCPLLSCEATYEYLNTADSQLFDLWVDHHRPHMSDAQTQLRRMELALRSTP